MTTKIKQKPGKRPKKSYLKNEPDVFWYVNAKGVKLWGFRHRYYDALGKRQEKPKQGLASENIAIRELLKVKTGLINGNTSRIDNSNLTVAEWLDIWIESYRVEWGIRTAEQYEGEVRSKIKPLLGKYKLSELNISTYRRKYINVLLKDFAPSSVALYHQIFKIAVNAAVEDEIIDKNRFNKITIKMEPRKDNYLTPVGLNHFLETAKRIANITNYTVFFLLAYTGLRKGESLGLRWSDVDFEACTLTVDRTRDWKGTRAPKTLRSYRTIPIDVVLVRQLKVYRTWCKRLKLSLGEHLRDDDYIFINFRTGSPSSENFSYFFNKVIEESRVKKITVHGLRHTHATILITKRPVNEVAHRLGNTPEMIHKVYGHLMEDMKIESVSAFSESLKNVASGS